jgi:hypothetical protein
MIKVFRRIRQNILTENKFSKYLLYAIGEIFLVVIGILIALQINTWNENRKSKKDERYVLTEVLKNLEEDAMLVDAIIKKRQKAKAAVIALQKSMKPETKDSDSLQFYLVDLLTFERYYPINNAFEILKSKGLQLSNNELTSKISRYYDYEQPQMSNSVLDIEVTIIKIFDDNNGLIQFLSRIEKDVRMVVKDPDDPIFKEKLNIFLVAFQDNNGNTLDKLLVFRDINKELRKNITNGLKVLN